MKNNQHTAALVMITLPRRLLASVLADIADLASHSVLICTRGCEIDVICDSSTDAILIKLKYSGSI